MYFKICLNYELLLYATLKIVLQKLYDGDMRQLSLDTTSSPYIHVETKWAPHEWQEKLMDPEDRNKQLDNWIKSGHVEYDWSQPRQSRETGPLGSGPWYAFAEENRASSLGA